MGLSISHINMPNRDNNGSSLHGEFSSNRKRTNVATSSGSRMS
jgi:hypothetical protein